MQRQTRSSPRSGSESPRAGSNSPTPSPTSGARGRDQPVEGTFIRPMARSPQHRLGSPTRFAPPDPPPPVLQPEPEFQFLAPRTPGAPKRKPPSQPPAGAPSPNVFTSTPKQLSFVRPAAPISQPVPKSQPSSQPQPVPKSKPLSQPQPVPKSKPSPQPQPVPKSKPSPQPQPVPKSKPSPQPQPVPKSKPSSQPQPVPKSKTSQPTPSKDTLRTGKPGIHASSSSTANKSSSQPKPSKPGPAQSSSSKSQKHIPKGLLGTRAPRPITTTSPGMPIFTRPDGSVDEEGGEASGKSTLRRIYSALIERCQDVAEKEGLQANLHNVMQQNIAEGSRLFHGLKRIGGGPGDMYMAFLHTQMCSQVIRSKSYTIGSESSGFKLEAFLKQLTSDSDYKGRLGEFSARTFCQKISEIASDCCKSAPHLSCMIGSFDRDKMEATTKEKKQRVAPKKRTVDENEDPATQHEELNIKNKKGGDKEAEQSPETLKTEIFNILKKHHRKEEAPVNLYEFCMDKNSFANTVESLFYVGFLIRDGFVSLTREKGTNYDAEKRTGRPGDSGLCIKPDRPVQKSLLNPHGDEGQPRNQYILSFSPRMFKSMSDVAMGDDIIPKYKSSDDVNDD